MKREIKFRAWHPESLQMIIGLNNRAMIDFEGKVLALDNISGNYRQPKGIILMQFTGLLDKNGKDIYEADILRFGNSRAEVFFRNGSFSTLIEEGLWLELSQNSFIDDMEVIGNIYENLELINN